MSWLPKQPIVVPVDFSDASMEAVKVALEIAGSADQVHVLHVLQPLHVAEPGMLWGTMTDDERIRISKEALDKALGDAGVSGVHSGVFLGNPPHVIADKAEEIGAELIVLPSHGRSGVSRLFLGSVTEKVLRLATCEVLVLRVKPSDNS